MAIKPSLLDYLADPGRGLPCDPLDRLAGFADGFWAARYHLGAADPIKEEFWHWFNEQRERSSAGWWTRLLQECGGDQVAAAQKLRDLIAEFRRQRGGASKDTKGTLFEWLADMRKWLVPELPGPMVAFNPSLPERKLARLAGYIDGYLEARIQLGAPDTLADEFFGWLAERGEKDWEAKFRRDFPGDEVAAIRKLLDLAAEFTRSKGLRASHGLSPDPPGFEGGEAP